jgi:alanyl-tRNA synthetase
VLVQRVDDLTMPELRTLSDKARHKVASGILVLGTVKEGKVSFLVIVSKALSIRVPAVQLAKHIAQGVGGSGGGRPEMAQGGGNQPERLDAALNSVYEYVSAQLG